MEQILKFQGCRKTTNCSRLTTNSTSNVRIHNLVSPIDATDPDEISKEVIKFIDSQPGGVLTYEGSTLLHARFVSNWWGFPDDLYVELVCMTNRTVGVWIQVRFRMSVISNWKLGRS
jgi:uncharacterized protein (DUF1499 family)